MEETREDLYSNFVRYFAKPLPPGGAVSAEQLAEIGVQLDTHLPRSYVEFITRHGPVYCPNILRLTITFELEYPDLRQFLPPQQVLPVTRAWWGRNLPGDLYVFATDCLGNPFCFRRSAEPLDDAPVFFLLQQNEELQNAGDHFDDMLRWYVEHVREMPFQPANRDE